MILKAVDVQNEQIVECILGADPHHKCEMLPNFSGVWDLRSELSTTILRVFFRGNLSDQTRFPPLGANPENRVFRSRRLDGENGLPVVGTTRSVPTRNTETSS